MTASADADPRPTSIGRAIASMATAIFLFSLMNATIKSLGDTYPVNQIVFFRAFFALVVLWPMIARAGGIASLKTTRPLGHAWRSLSGATAMACGFTAITLLPLANAAALTFTAPLFVTLLGVLLLGETVRWRRTLAIIVGFCGVLVMLAPELMQGGLTAAGGAGDGLALGAVLALLSAFFGAMAMIGIRRLSTTEKNSTIVFWFMTTAAVISGALLPFNFVMPVSWTDLALLVAIGLVGGIAQMLLTNAYRQAPVAVVAPFDYTAMIWATVWGFALWGEVPGLWVVGGALIVIASGAYITVREMKLGVQKPPPIKLRGEMP